MKKYILISCLIFIFAFSISYGSADISPYLQLKMLEAMENNQTLPVMIVLKDQVDIVALDKLLYEENATAEERAFRVITALQEQASNTQTNLLNYLSTQSKQEVPFYREYWIINAIELEAIPAILHDISKRSDVELLDYRYEEKLIKPVASSPAPEKILNNTEPGLKIVNAHKLWALGYTGAGTIVMNRDSGVDGNHPALSARWRGTHVPWNHAWLGPGSFPSDGGSSGHGTHTMGTITGMDPLTQDTIGVAPGAEWIAATSQYSFNSAFQWAMDPDGNPATTDDMPCVISNSMYIGSVPPGSCLASTYAALFNSVEAVGIAIVWSAGNEGPGAQTLTSPKNINTNLVNTFATGALNGGVPTLPIANFSSRGPSGCGGTGSILIKPEASAPGVNVRSAIPGGYGLKSGTSMACPHVAGAISLLKEAFPNKTGHEIKLALYFGAAETDADLFSNDPGEPTGWTSGEDHTYGMGVIDAFRAYEFLLLGYPPESPTNFQAFSDFSTPNSIHLNWNDPTSLVSGEPLNMNDYHIYIERDSVLIDSVSGGIEQYVDAGLNDGQEYQYLIYGSLDSSGISGPKVYSSWVAGGSPVPASPVIISINGNTDEIILHWINPSRNIDDTKMDDFAGIRLYQDNSLVTTFTRSSADTGRLDSATYSPVVSDYYIWNIAAIDNEIPMNESIPSNRVRTPINLIFNDHFQYAGDPNSIFWTNVRATIEDRSVNPPSPPFSLNLNGTGIPVGNDIIESYPIDLSAEQGKGVKFSYLYQPQGAGDPPQSTDSLRIHFRNDADEWIFITSYGGEPVKPFEQVILDMDSLSSQSNNYYYSQFQVRMSVEGRTTPLNPIADWFIDNIYIGKSMPMIGASADTLFFDSTLVNTQSQSVLFISNTGLDSLNILDINTSHPYFSFDTSLFQLAYSSNKQLAVTYLPQDAGVHITDLRIVSNAQNRDTLTITFIGVGITSTGLDPIDLSVPKEYTLAQNYPNPFNPTTTIHYELPRGSEVKLSVYNLLGQKVKTLVNGWMGAGRYDIEWQGVNDSGQTVSSGIYIYQLEAGEYQKTMKMILMK